MTTVRSLRQVTHISYTDRGNLRVDVTSCNPDDIRVVIDAALEDCLVPVDTHSSRDGGLTLVLDRIDRLDGDEKDAILVF